MVLARLADRIDLYRPKRIYVDRLDYRKKGWVGGRGGRCALPLGKGVKKRRLLAPF